MTPSISQELLLARCDFFVESQLWPLEQELDYHGWLSNFQNSELPYAESMLNAFLYYSKPMTKHLFQAAFRSIASSVVDASNAPTPIEQWNNFLNEVLVTHVTGEDPNPTDSGYHFSRLARQFLGIPEHQIVTNEAAIESLHFSGPSPVVFVDDFVGSGNQFRETWTRVHSITPTVHKSFQDLKQSLDFPTFYCPILCTWLGLQKLSAFVPSVTVSPAHFLDKSYSVFTPDSPIWPDHLRSSAEAVLHDVSQRAGIIDDWKGFRDLGLLVAFEHGVPDSTLPIVYHDQGWKPLVRRS